MVLPFILRYIKKNISYNNSLAYGAKKGHKHPYKIFLISDPFNNRAEIAKIAKGEKGVYLFEVKSKNLKYVGSSINLYNRVCSYFHLTRSFSTYVPKELYFPNTLNPWFVTGFCDAESSFYIVISKTNTVSIG